MTEQEKTRIVVVLGMHRSGTSAITRSLELMGVGLGANLHPAGFDNPKGFWEDRECIEINEALLRQFGSGYDRLNLIGQFDEEAESIHLLKEKARQVVKRKLEENEGIWGFKDPRTCRLLHFWQDVFNDLGCQAKYVIASRNPLSVASSLAARNHIPFEKSYFLWMEHMLSAVLDTAGFSRLVVDFDRFMETPLEQIARISDALSLPMPESGSIAQYIGEFLDKDLRHTEFSLSDLESDARVPGDVIALYKTLLSAAQDEISLDSPACRSHVAELSGRLGSCSPVFSYVNALEDELSLLHVKVARLDQATIEIRDLQQQLNEVLHTRSWRVTAPLRKALEAIRGIRTVCRF